MPRCCCSPKGERSRENKGPAGGGAAGRGRRERRDRGGSDKGENDESGTAARWHEGCSEKRRETAKRDTKRQTPQGGRRLAHHTLLSLKSLCGGGVPFSHPSLGLCVFFLSFYRCGLARASIEETSADFARFVRRPSLLRYLRRLASFSFCPSFDPPHPLSASRLSSSSAEDILARSSCHMRTARES